MEKKVEVSLSPERVSLGPGETAEFVATIHNASEVVEAYSVDVQGIDPAWSKLSVTSLSLFPGDRETVRIQVTPPVSSSAKAGSYPVSVRVISKRDPSIGTIASFILDLGKVSEYSLDLQPRKARGRKGAFQLGITNNGNTVSTYKLSGSDPEELCDFRFRSDTAAVDPGGTKRIPVIVNPRKKPITGAPRRFSFSLKTTPLEGDPKEAEGELECRALVPKWAVAAVMICVLGACAVIAALLLTGHNLAVLPIPAHDFTLAGSSFNCQEFAVDQAATIEASVKWKGADALTLVLVKPNGNECARTQGAEPLSLSDGRKELTLTYTVPEDEVNPGQAWKFYVANVAGKGTADVSLAIGRK